MLQELKLLSEGISKFPYFHKLYLMLGQLEERRGNADAARQAYQSGLKRCMASAPLWRSLSRLEERAGMIGKARNVLEQVRSTNPLTHVSNPGRVMLTLICEQPRALHGQWPHLMLL